MSDRNVAAAATGSTIKTHVLLVAAFLSCCLSSSVKADGLFPAGVEYEYDFECVLLADGSSGRTATGNPIGHRVYGRLSVANIWSASDLSSDDKLLRLHVSEHDNNIIIY